jgi:nitronate monooxygenase
MDDVKRWRDIWSAGQGVGSIHDLPTVAELVERMGGEFGQAADSLRRACIQSRR